MGLSFGASSAARRVAAAAVIASSLMVAPSVARADESAAEAFFQEGVNAMKRTDYTVACDAFAKSNKADPSPGTQINLALCFEKQKKWASAWTWYRSAFGLAQQRGQKEREQLADEAANRIRSQIHYVIVAVKEPVADLVVRRDGSEVATMLAGKDIPLPIDPGEHTLEVNAKGKKPWKHTFSIPDNAGTDTIQVPKLENDDAPAPTTKDESVRVDGAGRGDGQRLTGMLLGGAGLLAGIGSGVAFWLAKDQESERDARYEEAARKPEAERPGIVDSAKSFHDAAVKDQLIAFGLLGGAAVLVGVGAVVYFTAPKATKTTGAVTHVVPLLSPTAAGLGLGGTF